MPKGYARKVAAKKATAKPTVPKSKAATPKLTGINRALSNPGASKRSAQATAMLRRNQSAIKKMAAARKAKKKG